MKMKRFKINSYNNFIMVLDANQTLVLNISLPCSNEMPDSAKVRPHHDRGWFFVNDLAF